MTLHQSRTLIFDSYTTMDPDRENGGLLQIGEAARVTGFSPKTLRFYEEAQLIKPAARTRGGYRLYGESELTRLEFIKQAKRAGLSLKEIKELLELLPEHSSQDRALTLLEEILEARVVEIERQILELSSFRETFLHYYRERLL